jgi:hypothetical protein
MDIDKLEAGRKLDALVAEKIGLPLLDGNPTGNPMLGGGDRIRYSTDIAAAWRVIEKVIEIFGDYGFDLHRINNGVFLCGLGERDYLQRVSAHAPTAPLAICRAALKAIESKNI